MREKKYRNYTDEFKRESLALLNSSGKSAAQIEQDLGITPGMLLKWREQSRIADSRGGNPGQEPGDLEAAKLEILRLRRQLAEAEEEREILKKTLRIFSRRSE
jgi:transposase